MAFELPPLPYPANALEPYTSARTLELHHGKHHQAYVTTLNELTKETPMASESLEEVMHATADSETNASIYHNAAQVWNHTFFWNCMRPNGGGQPTGDAARRIDQAFGDLDKFKAQFKQSAVTEFGSGWAWLVLDNGTLRIIHTSNAANPSTPSRIALLTCDVWEHAYYLDYQNRRPDFVQTFLDHLVNWNFVAANMTKGR